MMTDSHLAIVMYRAVIANVESSKLDVRALWFANSDPEQIRELVMYKPLERYLNDEGQEVCWEVVDILAVEAFEPTESGEEVIGFITSTKAMPEWIEDDDDDE